MSETNARSPRRAGVFDIPPLPRAQEKEQAALLRSSKHKKRVALLNTHTSVASFNLMVLIYAYVKIPPAVPSGVIVNLSKSLWVCRAAGRHEKYGAQAQTVFCRTE